MTAVVSRSSDRDDDVFSTGLPVRRGDGELLGFLVEVDGRWVPCAVFGVALAEATPIEEAEMFLRVNGLSYVASTWEVCERGSWIAVNIVEASPHGVTVAYADWNHPHLFGTRRELRTPLGSEIRRR